MRTPSSFALLVPTASSPAAARLKGASGPSSRGAQRLVMAALVALVAVAAHATGGAAHGEAGTGDAAAKTVDVAATGSAVSETWAADESRNGTRPDAAH